MENGIGSYCRFLQGDKKAFEEIVALYSDALTFFAYGFLKDFSAAEDVMMDVFASLIVKKRRFKAESAFKTYLFRSARNKSIDRLRAEKRQVPLDFACDIPSGEPCDGKLLKNERREEVSRAMRQLPAAYRDVLYLVYFEALSVEETAAVLKKSKKQVYNALARAKVSLKKILS